MSSFKKAAPSGAAFSWLYWRMKDLSVLQEPPFTDRGSIVEVFTDLSIWAKVKSVIDLINANAAA